MPINKSQIILTKHALSRGKQRYVTHERIEQALMNPDKQFDLEDGKTKFIRVLNERQFQVVATYLPKEDKWLVISAWVRGEEDRAGIVETLLIGIERVIVWVFQKMIHTIWKSK